jgi:hypothetical protein
MSVFDSDKLLDEFNHSGKFPKIHDDIFTVIQNYSGIEPCMDFGSCYGLLSARMIKEGYKRTVIGVEGNPRYFAKAIKYPGVLYENFYISRDTFQRLSELIKQKGVKLVVARRVFPEIAGDDVSIVKELAGVLYESGIERIILEGRVPVENAKSPLSNVDKEVAALAGYYKLKYSYKNCRVLVRRV